MKKLLLVFMALFLWAGSSWAQFAIIGTGTTTSNGSAADPVERYYNYEHFQIVYTATELTTAGMPANATINALGFSISESAVSLANYTINMDHTLQALASPYITPVAVNVRSSFTYAPVVQTAGNFDMITFTTNFVWNGTSNIVIDICTGSNPFTSPYGGLRYTTATSGAMRGIRSDGASNCGTATSTNSAYKPNIRFNYTSSLPGLSAVPGSINFGYVPNGNYGYSQYLLSGVNLTSPPGNIVVTPSTAFFEVSNDNTNWYATINVPYSSATLTNYPVYVRYVPSGTPATHSATITNVGGGASTNVAVSGSNDLFSVYCPSAAGSTGDEEITLVQFGSTLNNSGTCASLVGSQGTATGTADLYSNFTSITPTDVPQGGPSNITVQITQCGAGTYSHDVRVYIDFNQNGLLTDPGEETIIWPYAGSGTHTITFPINVPGGATLGNTLLRVVCKESSTTGPCLVSSWGETEDYKINIVPPLACPAPYSLTATNFTIVGADLGWTSPDSFFDIFIQSTGLPAPGPATTPTENNWSGNSYTWTGGTIGNTYDWYVRTDCDAGGGTGISTWSGPNTFSLNNDYCGLAIAVSCGNTYTGTTTGATPDAPGACNVPNYTNPGVWYRFTGIGDMVSVDLCTGTTWDSQISIYSGTCGSLSCVDGNDDYCALQSRMDWFAETGVDYYILVHQYGASGGAFTLTVNCIYPAIATWDGGDFSVDWFGADNWVESDVPGTTTNVIIPTGLSYYPSVDRKGTCNNISIASGARLVDLGIGYLIPNGTATVDQNYTGGEWHLISSPVTGATANMFLGLYLQNHTESTNAYTDISNPATALNVMQGYALWNDLAGTASFVGTLNTGNFGSGLTRTGQGWNLVGNPYASPIDWDAVTGWTKTDVENATYRHVNNVTWAEYVGGIGANGGTRYIAPNQGFFVRVTSGFALGTLGMTNDVRTHSTAPFFKDEIADIVRLEISGNGYTNETVIRFLDVATPEFDGDWDAHKLFGIVPEAPAIYSSENDMMAINSLPATNTVPVGVKAGVPGEFTITATETSEFADVILEDLLMGSFTDLKSNSYTFNYDMNFDNRFIVHFTPLAVGEIAADLINIYSSQKDVYVSVPANTEGEIVVYNLMGQEVARTMITNVVNKITLDNSAYYVVKVMSNESVVTKKVFVK